MPAMLLFTSTAFCFFGWLEKKITPTAYVQQESVGKQFLSRPADTPAGQNRSFIRPLCIERFSVWSAVSKPTQNRKRMVPIKACFGSYLLLGDAIDHCTTDKYDKNSCCRSLILLELIIQ